MESVPRSMSEEEAKQHEEVMVRKHEAWRADEYVRIGRYFFG
jgi:hypothetical protein